jgi:hypothetical protein
MKSLLFLLLVSTFLLLGSSGSALTLYATRTSTTVWRGESKVNVLLGVETNDKGRHVDNLACQRCMIIKSQPKQALKQS